MLLFLLTTRTCCRGSQNQRIRPHFNGRKCRSRSPQSFGPVLALILKKVNKHEGFGRPDGNVGQTCVSGLPTQKGCAATQNQRIRPYFSFEKCRSRYSASIGPVHVPKLGLCSPNKPEGGVGKCDNDDDTTRRLTVPSQPRSQPYPPPPNPRHPPWTWKCNTTLRALIICPQARRFVSGRLPMRT